jgi:hypothetical protein
MRFGAQDNGIMRFGAQDNGIMRFGAHDNGIMKVPIYHAGTLPPPVTLLNLVELNLVEWIVLNLQQSIHLLW